MAERSASMSAFGTVRWLFTVGSMIAAVVVGLMFQNCDKEMSTWLLVRGFMTPVVGCLVLVLVCLAIPALVVAAGDGPGLAIFCLLVPTVLGVLGIIIFAFGWTIYGAVIFFPAAPGPYPECEDGKDRMILVITGTIVVATSFVFCCSPGFRVNDKSIGNNNRRNNMRVVRRSSSSTTGQPKSSAFPKALEMERMSDVEVGKEVLYVTSEEVEDDEDVTDGPVSGLRSNGFVGLILTLAELGSKGKK